jgi:hypothetical protein
MPPVFEQDPSPDSATFLLNTNPVDERATRVRDIGTGAELEGYVRYLQLTGAAGSYPWSLRGLSAPEVRSVATELPHPWRATYELRDSARPSAWTEFVPLSLDLWYNTGFPYGSNDGPVWAGRGATIAVRGGVSFGAGPLTVRLAPIWFGSENRAFDLLPTGRAGPLVYADGLFPNAVDRPQRFGNGGYSRLDPGESSIRLDAGPVAVGVSSASQSWGPMAEYPFLLGAGAPGIPHIFAGTSRPLNIGIGRLHGRVIWGRLEQSNYSPVQGSKYYVSATESGRIRFASGVVATLTPRGLPGLELGLGRFFHSPWPAEGLPSSYFGKPFETILKRSLVAAATEADSLGDPDNQLAAVFARWVFPGSGFEVYGEYGREDHNWDLRDFLNEPDHARTYGLGFRKIFGEQADRFRGLRAELMNFQLPTLARHRSQGAIYLHTILRQGHTHHGQLLGADVGVGAASGAMVAWDSYTPAGRSTVFARRNVRQERGQLHETGIAVDPSTDVSYSLGAERLRFRGRAEVTSSLAMVWNLNRNFGGDAFNLNAHVAGRFRF